MSISYTDGGAEFLSLDDGGGSEQRLLLWQQDGTPEVQRAQG